MATEDLTLRMRAVGGRVVATEVESAERSVGRYSSATKEAHKSTSLFAGGLSRLRSAAAFAMGTVGLTGLGIGIGKAIHSATEFQDQTTQMNAALRAAHVHSKDASQGMQEFADASAIKGGFAPAEELKSMTAFVRVTKDATKSERDMAIATEVARGTHKSLETATRAVMMAEAGRMTGLSRLGIILPKHATATQAMAALQQRYAGATTAYSHTFAGAMSNFSNMIDILGQKLGAKIIPVLTGVVTALSKFVTQMEQGKGAGGAFRDVIETVWKIAVVPLWNALKATMGALGSFVTAFKEGRAWAVPLMAVIVGLTAGIATYRIVTLAVATATRVWGAAQLFLNAAMDANPVTIVIAAIVGLIAVLVLVYVKVKAFREIVNAAFNGVKTGVTSVVGFVKQHWRLLVSILTGPFGALVIYVASHFRQIIAFFKALPNQIWQQIKGLARLIERPFVDAYNFVHRKLNDFLSDARWLVGALGRAFGALAGKIIWPFKWAFDWVAHHLPHFHTVHVGPVSLPVPGLQSGGMVTDSGVFQVGERGPETMFLPRGAAVAPAGMSYGAQLPPITLEAHHTIVADGYTLAKVVSRQGVKAQSLR